MCPKKLNYAAGDDLALYATPEEAMREGRRQLEAEKARKQWKYDMNNNGNGGRINSTPPNTMPMPNSVSNSNSRQSSTGSIPHQRMVSGNNGRPPFQGNYHQHPSAMSVPVTNLNNAYSTPQQFKSSNNRIPPPNLPDRGIQQGFPNMASPVMNNGQSNRNAVRSEEDRDNKVAISLFSNHDVRGKGRLTAEELQNLLQNDDSSHFCMSAIDSLINLFGASRFGTINQQEFISLYKRVKNWRIIYVDNDINRSFTLTVNEFHNALQELGYLIPFEVTEKLFDQYAEFINQSVNGKELKFDKFVESLVWLMRLSKLFRRHDPNKEGIATVQYKDFIDMVLYLGRFLPH